MCSADLCSLLCNPKTPPCGGPGGGGASLPPPPCEEAGPLP